MGTCDLAPDATKFSFFGSLFLLGFVNEGNSFTHVELCFTFVTDVLQFEQRCFFVLISQTTFVTHDKTSNIQTAQNKEADGEGLIKRKKISIAPDKTMVEERGWWGRGLGRIDVVDGLIELAFPLHHWVCLVPPFYYFIFSTKPASLGFWKVGCFVHWLLAPVGSNTGCFVAVVVFDVGGCALGPWSRTKKRTKKYNWLFFLLTELVVHFCFLVCFRHRQGNLFRLSRWGDG